MSPRSRKYYPSKSGRLCTKKVGGEMAQVIEVGGKFYTYTEKFSVGELLLGKSMVFIAQMKEMGNPHKENSIGTVSRTTGNAFMLDGKEWWLSTELNGKPDTYTLYLLGAEITKDEADKSINERTALFDRVVMPQGYKQAILEALSQEKKSNREKLWVEWGFDDIIEKGRGLIFLFWGPPGTGKTMCAQGIASYLGKKYIMLSSGDVESSIPGQCERNIKQAFAQATKEGSVIIIDECDSLLYARNQVGAIMGAQINSLLTEIERFEGVCVLTTNRSILLDPALERRVVLKLEFEKPDEPSRAKIWRNLVPEKCPLHTDVDFKLLAKYDISGGNIKNAILAAARKAIFDKKDCISMTEFTIGVERELLGQKGFTRVTSKKTVRDVVEEGIVSEGSANDISLKRDNILSLIEGTKVDKKRKKDEGTKS